jgi:hypothetical protein
VTVSFLRTKTATVEAVSGDELETVWRLADDLADLELRMRFKLPDLEITSSGATVHRHTHPGYASAADAVGKVKGVRIASGLRKIVTGLMGAEPGADELVEGVLESCNAVILHFTLPQIRFGETMTDEEKLAANRRLVEQNPRMLGSCVVWQPGSPLLEVLGVEKGGGS